MVGPSRNIDKSQPLYLQGDELIYDTGGNKVVARGNVEIYYNNYILTADQVVYDQSANTLTAVGNVILKEPNGNVVRADRYTLTDDFRDGFVSQLSIVASDDTRIAAEQRDATRWQHDRLHQRPVHALQNHRWHAAAVVLERGDRGARPSGGDHQLSGRPVRAIRRADPLHALLRARRSVGEAQVGLPDAAAHVSDTLGYSTTIPYYFALAPNYDFTFYPMYTSRQGILWQGEWRHRTENGQYYIKGAGIDQDSADLPSSIENREQYNGWRGSLETKGLFNLGSWWKLGWDVTMELDDEFRRFYKLDNALLTDRVNRVFLAGLSDRNYFELSAYEFTDLGFTTPGTSETKQYAYPIMDYNYVFADPILGGELTWTTNALALSSNQDPTTFAPFADTNQQMNRVVTELNWRRRFTDPIGITYTPFAQLRGDAYQINNFVDPFDPTAPLQETSFARGLALGGVTVAYPWVANTSRGSHVIEPIGQIIGRQASIKQDGLPNEDAQSLIFDDTNLFEVTKFSGYDRIETGTRANVGLQYTFQANDGGYARILAGESYHLAGTNAYADPSFDVNGNPVFTTDSGLQTDRSDYVLGAYVAPWTFLQLISQSRFDQSSFALARQDAGAQLNLGPLSANAVYAYLNTDPTNGIDTAQQDVYGSLNIRLTDRWSVGGGIRYDLDADEIASDMFQVRYGDECFVLTATYTDNYYVNPDIVDGQTLMLRFELKHLGEFGYSTDVLSGTSISEQQSGG